jgi:uncharacterized lipoprotein
MPIIPKDEMLKIVEKDRKVPEKILSEVMYRISRGYRNEVGFVLYPMPSEISVAQWSELKRMLIQNGYTVEDYRNTGDQRECDWIKIILT